MTITLQAEAGTVDNTRASLAITRLATIADQVLVAIANFALTLSISRAFGAEEVAAYGIGLSIALMIQGTVRHTIIVPLILQNTSRVLRRRGGILAQHLTVLSVVLGLGCAFLVFDAWAGIGGFALLVLSSSVACVVIYMQIEFARAILVKLQHPLLLLGTALWYTTVCAALSVAALFHLVGYLTLMAVLAGAMLLHVAALRIIVGTADVPQGFRLLTADMRKYGFWALISAITYSGYTHFPLFILSAAAEPIYAASFVATRSLLQPLPILLRGLDIVDKSTFANQAVDPHSIKAFRLILRQVIPYGVTAALFCLMATLEADRLLELSYGDKFRDGAPMLVAWTPVFFLLSVYLPFESLVYARHEFPKYHLIRTMSSIFALALTLPLIWNWQGVGAIVACGLGNLIALAGTMFMLHRGSRT